MEHVTHGRVIWITGLSGAGKTTVAHLVKKALEGRGACVALLDGDELREVMPLGDRFDRESRLALALAYGRLCRLLASQGLTVVCATISMRAEVYAWNRRHIPGYFEVFLDVAEEIRIARDPKRHYVSVGGGALTDFAGRDQTVDYPPAPDLWLKADKNERASETAAQVLRALDSRRLDRGHVRP